jgi:hypothetical protein
MLTPFPKGFLGDIARELSCSVHWEYWVLGFRVAGGECTGGDMVRIIVTVASFILAIYLSLKPRPISNKLKAIVWSIALLIAIGNIYAWVQEQRQQKPFVDALIPDISSTEAFDLIENSFGKELNGYVLTDVIGSSYICVTKPDEIFHRFPEWTLIFRKDQDRLLEFKVSDSRIPDPPSIPSSELSAASDGQIAYYIISKKGFYASTGNTFGKDSGINYAIDIIDHRGRAIIIMQGHGPEDNISETEDGLNSKVLARVQIIGRPTDHVSEYHVIEDIANKRTIYIKKATAPMSPFYASLAPISNWKIDVKRAIEIAIDRGAKGAPPGKEGVGGQPTVRLYDGHIYGLQGAYWKIPYRIAIRPLLIDASSGKLYAVNNEGKYATEWESSLADFPSNNDDDKPGQKAESATSDEEKGAETRAAIHPRINKGT